MTVGIICAQLLLQTILAQGFPLGEEEVCREASYTLPMAEANLSSHINARNCTHGQWAQIVAFWTTWLYHSMRLLALRKRPSEDYPR